MRQLLLNKPEKNSATTREHVDGIYREMMHFIADHVQTWPDARGGRFSFNVHSQTVNVSHGAVCGALPDGRLAGEAFCDNASPMMGRDVSGPTATVKSVASMGQEAFHDGALFNLRFDPKGVEGEKRPCQHRRGHQDLFSITAVSTSDQRCRYRDPQGRPGSS